MQIPAGTTLTINSTTTNSAIQIGTQSTLIGEGTLSNLNATWADSNPITAINLKNSSGGDDVYSSIIDIGTIEYFDIGISMGDTKGIQCNDIKVRKIKDVKVGFWLHPSTGGWANNNYIEAGFMENTRSKTGTYGIKMNLQGGDANTNTFSGRINGYFYGIQLMGAYNRLVGLHIWNVIYRIFITGDNGLTRKNYLYGAYGEIYPITNGSTSHIPIDPYAGETPIYNDSHTDDTSKYLIPLSNVLTIFGWDDYTYLKQIWVQDVERFSDERIKENITGIENATTIILDLKGKKYNLKTDTTKHKTFGFIAQDLLQVLPELVGTNPFDSLYSIDYTGIIPILAEAFKQREKQLADFNSEIYKLQKANSKLIVDLQNNNILPNYQIAEIIQQPLVFECSPQKSNSTFDINYFVPDTNNTVTLIITDINGKLIKQIEGVDMENNKFTIYGNTLQPGLYYYTLATNHQISNTQPLIIKQ